MDVKVPTFFWLEIGNRLIRLLDVAGEQVLEGIVRLEALGLRTIEMDRSLRLLAIHLAQRFRLSTYDALYLALADTSDLPLATLDGRLATAAASLGRRYGDDPGVRDRVRRPSATARIALPTRYRWPRWERISRSCVRRS